MRKYLSLAATLGVLFSVMAIRPAAAVDEVAASVAGTVDVNTGACNTKDAAYGGDGTNNAAGNPGAAGQKNEFGQVLILGAFQAGGTTVYAGPLGVTDVIACSVSILPPDSSSGIPAGLIQSAGFLTGGTFGTPSGLVGTVGGGLGCLDGTLDDGGAFSTVLAQATAVISASWTLHPVNPVTLNCTSHPTTVLASGSATLQARVVAVPNGEFGIDENRVEGIVTSH